MSTQEFAVNKIAAEFVRANLEGFLDVATSTMRGARGKLRLKMKGTYKAYLDRILDRYSKAKSFLLGRSRSDRG